MQQHLVARLSLAVEKKWCVTGAISKNKYEACPQGPQESLGCLEEEKPLGT